MGLLGFGTAIIYLQQEFDKAISEGTSESIRDFALSVLAYGEEQAQEASCGCLGSEPTETVRIIVESLT